MSELPLKAKAIALEAKSDDPEKQKFLKDAAETIELLTPEFNYLVENATGGALKRLVKALVTFQDVKLKKEEFDLASLAEELLRKKWNVMLSAAHSNVEKIKQEYKDYVAETATDNEGEGTNGL